MTDAGEILGVPLDDGDDVHGLQDRFCALCDCRLTSAKKQLLNNVRVCWRCRCAFANRRELAFMFDLLVWAIAVPLLIACLSLAIVPASGGWAAQFPVAAAILLFGTFILRDGFSGWSPGKRFFGLRTVDAGTLEPIGFIRSAKRNSVLLVFPAGLAVLGAMSALPVLPIIAISSASLGLFLLGVFFVIRRDHLLNGRRLGDRWAGTLVVCWNHRSKLPFDQRGIRCHRCGYDLHGNVSGICSECGTPVPEV